MKEGGIRWELETEAQLDSFSFWQGGGLSSSCGLIAWKQENIGIFFCFVLFRAYTSSLAAGFVQGFAVLASVSRKELHHT